MSRQQFLQISRFLLVGSLVTLVDFLLYTFSLFQLGLTINTSKTIGFLGAVSVGFILHSRCTFAVKKTSLNQLSLFVLVYLFNLGLNVYSNSLFLSLVGVSKMGILFSFLAATTLCAITNFLGQKYLVFRGHAETSHSPHSSKHRF